MSNDIATRLRATVDADRISTHSPECWQWHRDCALLMACDEIDRLREELGAMGAEVGRLCRVRAGAEAEVRHHMTKAAAARADAEALLEELEAMRARGGDRARITCPHCSRLKVEELPVLRCITCGTGYYEEVDR